MNISFLSERYLVQRIQRRDVAEVFELCRKNRLYYEYCPPFVSEQSIVKDMHQLPPDKQMEDKYYLGYYEGQKLIAVLDLIMDYPDQSTAFIGFFMTDVSVQNNGIGSGIIEELCGYLSRAGIAKVRLGWVKGNPQAEHFWRKNGFTETGVTSPRKNYTVTFAQRVL